MYHSISFYDGTHKYNTYENFHLVPQTRPFVAPPEPKTKYLDLPGAHGQLDLSESLTGYPLFNNREGEWSFYVLNDYLPSQPNVVNMLPAVYYRTALSGDPYTTNGITWTVNGDGSIKATGMATADSIFSLTGSGDSIEGMGPLRFDSSKRYTVSGCTGGSYDNTYSIVVRLSNSLPVGTGSGTTTRGISTTAVTLPTGYQYAYVFLMIRSGYSCPSEGITFYPMVELGNTAHPYQSPQDGVPYERKWAMRLSSIMSAIQGRRLKAVLDDDPSNYYVGRFYVSEWESEETYSTLTISYNVEPYKHSCEEQTGTNSVYLSDLGGTSL